MSEPFYVPHDHPARPLDEERGRLRLDENALHDIHRVLSLTINALKEDDFGRNEPFGCAAREMFATLCNYSQVRDLCAVVGTKRKELQARIDELTEEIGRLFEEEHHDD